MCTWYQAASSLVWEAPFSAVVYAFYSSPTALVATPVYGTTITFQLRVPQLFCWCTLHDPCSAS